MPLYRILMRKPTAGYKHTLLNRNSETGTNVIVNNKNCMIPQKIICQKILNVPFQFNKTFFVLLTYKSTLARKVNLRGFGSHIF